MIYDICDIWHMYITCKNMHKIGHNTVSKRTVAKRVVVTCSNSRLQKPLVPPSTFGTNNNILEMLQWMWWQYTTTYPIHSDTIFMDCLYLANFVANDECTTETMTHPKNKGKWLINTTSTTMPKSSKIIKIQNLMTLTWTILWCLLSSRVSKLHKDRNPRNTPHSRHCCGHKGFEDLKFCFGGVLGTWRKSFDVHGTIE